MFNIFKWCYVHVFKYLWYMYLKRAHNNKSPWVLCNGFTSGIKPSAFCTILVCRGWFSLLSSVMLWFYLKFEAPTTHWMSKQFNFSFLQTSSPPVWEKIVTSFFRGSYRKYEMEGHPYMKTYVKISSICNQLIYSLYLKYCLFTFKSSFKKTYFCMKTYGSAN